MACGVVCACGLWEVLWGLLPPFCLWLLTPKITTAKSACLSIPAMSICVLAVTRLGMANIAMTTRIGIIHMAASIMPVIPVSIIGSIVTVKHMTATGMRI